jgi:hypothetical protein
LTVRIDESAIGKFDYFYINIPLGHYGIICDTKIMVQVGEVTLINNKTILHWDLKNKVFDSNIVLSGTVFYQKTDKTNKEGNKYDSQISKNMEVEINDKGLDEIKHNKNNEKNFNIEEMIKSKHRHNSTSDIMSTNCYCKIHFKLNNHSLSKIEIDKKSLLFYPKLAPKIDIKRQFVSNDYVIWNCLSFNNNEVNIPEKPEIGLLKINIEENFN